MNIDLFVDNFCLYLFVTNFFYLFQIIKTNDSPLLLAVPFNYEFCQNIKAISNELYCNNYFRTKINY